MHSHSSFDGGIHTSRKCLFNNQLKVSQAASLQGNVYTEELSEESKKGGGDSSWGRYGRDRKGDKVGRNLES